MRLLFILLLGTIALAIHAQMADPGTLENVGNLEVGQTLDIMVTGLTSGAVWGTDVYTTDSQIAVAAVHSGVVSVGQTARVQVEVLAGASRYQGSERNGVVTNSWGAYDFSFRFITVNVGELPAFSDPAALEHLGALTDQVFYFVVQGAIGGSVWGSGPYTTDSSLASAAVHAGALRVGQTGLVQVTIVSGQSTYPGSARNGITTANWGSYGSSFHVEAATGSYFPIQFASSTAERLSGVAVGSTISVFVVGGTNGPVWGSGPYTGDSDIGTAAVHAGLLGSNESGVIKVQLVAGQSSYSGSTRNSVTTSDWGSYDLGFILAQ